MISNDPTPVVEVGALGDRWPCVDPFLMCNYHVDDYPAGDGRLGPQGTLTGRDLGADFSGRDGWNMYHGTTVPGFPRHPHRGFETITYARRGLVDHSDSLGATARYGNGDVQWLTAGRGIEHAEMFPLVDTDAPNPLELFQVWVNLPARSKLVDPHFTMLWDEDLPRLAAAGSTETASTSATLTLIAGAAAGLRPPAPPPDSWAADPRAHLAVWHVFMPATTSLTLPAATGEGLSRILYAYRDAGLDVSGTQVEGPSYVALEPTGETTLTAGPATVEALVLQGRPLGEPVAHYGPFVMNTQEELRTAFTDYEAGRFGTWGWPADDHTHLPDRGRFAHHADGRIDQR